MDKKCMNALRANLKKRAVARLVLYSELSKYYTKEEVDQILADIAAGEPVDLHSYVKKSEVEATPVEESENPVSSGGVYSAMSRMGGNLSDMVEVSGEAVSPDTMRVSAPFDAGEIFYTSVPPGSTSEFVRARMYYVSKKSGAANTLLTNEEYFASTASGAEAVRLSSEYELTADLHDYVKKSEVDTYPTEFSENPVSSNGVFSDLTGIGRVINQLLSIEGTEIENPDNRVAPSDFKSGDIFYVEDGSYSRYVNGIRYYIAKVDGEAGVSLNDSNLFYNTFSRIEAVRKSDSMRSVSVTVEQELSDTQKRRAQENIGIEEYATADQIHALFS